ncbi:DUF1206 domain-containing protein [Chromohalobacter moromii]|uniref:DUF1206 domain-containing protein n=1 Tax=Chromohalobacter moromii TaxID=2860329 RepID=A0A9X2X3C4_9GAMM|nr:DUF1206 domain-containing protein [Chromohalobacter moromii]MCK2046616.1 DUF1206 domain-containing protein [Chromohalobacter moromii]MCT8506192.1 DUF1206 domain-containing protein [Chromohalobacter moromii]CDQ36576.1 hypothetical protein BN993_06085 [Virgibacillus halodenitrificans]
MKFSLAGLRNALSGTASAGYIAKGVVYVTVGWLSLLTTIGLGGQQAGTGEVIRAIALWPFGTLLIALLGIGLLAYVLWRLAQAWWDLEHKGSDWKGILQRLGFAISGLLYIALAWQCATLLILSLSSGGDSSTAQRTAELLDYPGGLFVLLGIGIAFVCVGLHQFYRAWKRHYRRNWHIEDMPQGPMPLLEGIARLGLAARGLVFVIIGTFLSVAAIEVDPDNAEGLGGVLQTLAEQPYGRWLLGGVSLGLVAYGLYCFINAGYRRTRTPRL